MFQFECASYEDDICKILQFKNASLSQTIKLKNVVKRRRTNADIVLSTLSFIEVKIFCKSQPHNRLVPLNENLLCMRG